MGYILLVIAALEIELATDNPGQIQAFQDATFGFTAFSILATLVVSDLWFYIVTLMVLFNGTHICMKRRNRVKGFFGPNIPLEPKVTRC